MVTINKRTLTMLCASLALSACSTANISQSAIPEQGLTVSQLYQQSMQQPIQKAVVQQVRFEDSGDEFKQLPNPEVPIHILRMWLSSAMNKSSNQPIPHAFFFTSKINMPWHQNCIKEA